MTGPASTATASAPTLAELARSIAHDPSRAGAQPEFLGQVPCVGQITKTGNGNETRDRAGLRPHRDLFDDEGIDVVYLTAPRSEHRALALGAIGAGTHVLIDKPIAVSAAEAEDSAAPARAADVFALDAMRSAFRRRPPLFDK